MDKQQNNIFMAVVARSMEQVENETSKDQMFLYKWNAGEGFEKIQRVVNFGIDKVTPFSIGDMSFLALANSKGVDGKLCENIANSRKIVYGGILHGAQKF